MNRAALRRIVLAGLAVVALATAAATVDSTTVAGGGDPSLGTGGSGTVGADDAGDVGLVGGTAGRLSVTLCVPALADPRAVGLLVAAFLAVGALVYYDTRSILPPLAVWLAVGPPVGVLYLALTACGPSSVGAGGRATVGNVSILPAGSGAGAFGTGGGSAVSTPTALLGVLLGVAVVGSVALLLVSTADEADPVDADDDPSPPDPDVAAVGRAAGRAADRIEADADVDNEVFRAWIVMTDHLAVPNRQSATPAEFAAAAVDAGMAREDVAELSTLFEAVRYGDAAPTDEREARALAALRRVEAAYADRAGPTGNEGEGDRA